MSSTHQSNVPPLVEDDDTVIQRYKGMVAQFEADGMYDLAYQLVKKVEKRHGVKIPLNKTLYDAQHLPVLATVDLMEDADYHTFYSFDQDIEETTTAPSFAETENEDIDVDKVQSVPDFAYKRMYHHINTGAGSVDHVVFSQEGLYYAVLHANAHNKLTPDYHLTFNSAAKIYQAHHGVSTASHAANASTLRANNNVSIKPAVRAYSDHPAPVSHVEFHPVEPFIVSCSGNTVRFHDHSRNAEQTAFRQLIDPQHVHTFTVHPAGNHMVLAADNALLRLYDLATFEAYVNANPRKIKSSSGIQDWIFSDGLPASHPNVKSPFSKDASNIDPVSSSATDIPGISSTGPARVLVSGTGTKLLPVVELESTGLHTARVRSLAYAANGSLLASGSDDGSIKLWSGKDMSLVHTLANAHGSASISQVSFTPNGMYLLSYGRDGAVNVVDTRTYKPVYRCAGLGNHAGTGQMALSADGKYIVATDDNTLGITFFDSTNGQIAHRMTHVHTKPIVSLSFNPLHDCFLTGSRDNTYKFFSGNDNFDF